MLQAGLYLSNCFEARRIDYLLYPYYKKDLERGKTSEETAYSLFKELFEDIEKRLGHPSAVHVTIGGTDLEGKASYNSLTKIAIKAIRGLRTPNVTLRVREDMPQDMGEQINLRQHTEGLHMPTPIKSLLTGDCIKEGKSVLGGGACYNFDSTNIYGSTNTINALYAIKEFYADKFGVLSRESFLDSFIKNYEDNKGIYTKYNEVYKFGN